MKTALKFLLCTFLLCFTMKSFGQMDTKSIGAEATVFARTMDRLFAMNEMKDSLALLSVRNILQQQQTGFVHSNSEIDRKVRLLTNEDDLKKCQTSYKETKSPDGSSVDTEVDYRGEGCPVVLNAIMHVKAEGMQMSASGQSKIEIVSEPLKKELDIFSATIPLEVKMSISSGSDGLIIDSATTMNGQFVSQKIGLIQMNASLHVVTIWGGAGLKGTAESNELYQGGNEKITFTKKEVFENDNKTTTYKINDVTVTKEEYEQRHSDIILPGITDEPRPLAQPHTCEVKTYDSAAYPLETVRRAIREKNIGSFKVAEALPNLQLLNTGKNTLQIRMDGQPVEIELKVNDDAARFVFFKDQTSKKEQLGRVTAVLGAPVDLTTQILNRVTRVTCYPR